MGILKSTQIQIIRSNHKILSTICWYEFMRFGKGFFLFPNRGITNHDIRETIWIIPHQTSKLEGIYIGEKSYAFTRLFQGDWQGLTSDIEIYNPRKVCLVGFYQDNNTFDLHLLDEANLNPFDCFSKYYLELKHYRLERIKRKEKMLEEFESNINLEQSAERAAAIELRDLISDISESAYYAGWQMGIEYILWEKLINQEKGSIELGVESFSQSTLENLKELSQKAQGWWLWKDEAKDKVFIPLNLWSQEFNQYANKKKN